MRVHFLEHATIKVDGVTEIVFEAGAKEDLTPDSAQRWIRRGVAVELHEAPAKKKATRKKSAAKG